MVTAMPTSIADAMTAEAANAPRGVAGALVLTAERVGERTRLTHVRSRAPLQVLRAHYLDVALPDMAFVTIANASGGVLQGDRLDMDVHGAAGARLRIDTQGSTRLYRAPAVRARATTRITLDDGAYLEYLPDPYVPFAGSDFATETTCTVSPRAMLVVVEVIAAGRVARGEIHRFARFESRMTLVDADGRTLAADALVLEGRDEIAVPGLLGSYGAIGTVMVAAPGVAPALLREAAAMVDPGCVGGHKIILYHYINAFVKVK